MTTLSFTERLADTSADLPTLMDATRADFPILEQRVQNNKRLIYLDNAATTQKPVQVLAAMDSYYRTKNANVHRGVHSFSEQATAAYESARATVARFINAPDPACVIFTRNATEAINLVAQAWGGWQLQAGDVIISTEMEHHANIVSWQLIAERTGAIVKYIPVTAGGELDLDAYTTLLNAGRVRIVAVAHVSNVLGTINPVDEIIRLAHAQGAIVLLDAAQSAPHMALDVQALNADFVAFSAHKLLGPTGIGVLYGKSDLLEAMPPFMGGGSMIKRVTLERTTYADAPAKFEAGTPAIAEAVGLGAALDYVTALGIDRIAAWEHALIDYTMQGLGEIAGLRMIGPATRAGLVSFTLAGAHPHDVAQMLDSAGIAVRAGHHCAMPLHDKLNLNATTRASFYLYNTVEDANQLIAAVRQVQAFFA